MLTKLNTLDAMVLINQNFKVPYNGINCDYFVEIYESEHHSNPMISFKAKDSDKAVDLLNAIDDGSIEIMIHGSI